MDNSAENLEDRKLLERDWYDRIYREAREFSSAELREGILGASEKEFRERLRALCGEGRRVLEIGCGEGVHAILAAMAGADVVAIDISPEGLTRARENALRVGVGSKIDFRLGDIEALAGEGNQFDVVLDHESLSSVVPRRAIAESHRVLKPGGVFLALECYGHNPVFNLNRWLKRVLGKRTAWAASNILKKSDLKYLETCFQTVTVKRFHFATVFAAPFIIWLPASVKRAIVGSLDGVDRLLLNRTPLGSQCFKVLIEAVR